MAYRNIKKINIGSIGLGNGYIPVQTMIKNPITEVERTISKIHELSIKGCDIIRVAVPDTASIRPLKEIIKNSEIPIVADIHFDYRLAIKAIESGVQKIRINPGNIGNRDRVRKIIDCLREYRIPVRIGVNGGSLPSRLMKRYSDPAKVMIEAAKEEVGFFEESGYDNIVLSFKASSVVETFEVNKLARNTFLYPLHIGITEAGDIVDGTIKNSAGISALLLNKIGDTIRVSLTSSELEEVRVGKKILESVGLREADYEVISCPTCGRAGADIQALVSEVKRVLDERKPGKKLRVAVMGCVVNGPGEAKNADLGIACGKGASVLFKEGKKIKLVENSNIKQELLGIIDEFIG